MGKDETALLEAIKADATGSSDAREVYADWLEEQERSEQAEYLRLEIEVRGFEFITGNADRMQKKARRDELEDRIEKTDPKWLADVSRAAGVRVARPRPTGAGLAALIAPAPKPSAPEAPFTDLQPLRGPFDAIELPDPYETQRKAKFKGKLVLEILLAIAAAGCVIEVVTKGPSAVMHEMVEYYYLHGHF